MRNTLLKVLWPPCGCAGVWWRRLIGIVIFVIVVVAVVKMTVAGIAPAAAVAAVAACGAVAAEIAVRLTGPGSEIT